MTPGAAAGIASAIYVGEVSHRRLRPRAHALRYRMFMLLLDLDELPELELHLRFFSLGRFNLFGFRSRDHGDGSTTPLRDQIEARLDAEDLSIAGGPIRLLCLPRVLGYVFNPLSIYFCSSSDGILKAIVYEVSSTFGNGTAMSSRPTRRAGGPIRQRAKKQLHVSPFLGMDLDYAFRIVPPAETTAVAIDAHDAQGPILFASFTGERRPLTDAGLWRAFATHPLLTLKVVAGIHWEALLLIAKGLNLTTGPPAPKGGGSRGVLVGSAPATAP